VPVKAGVVSLVKLSVLLVPLSVEAVMSGAAKVAGGVISTVSVVVALGLEVFPATSVCTAVMACEPSVSGMVGVQVQVPPTTAIGLPSAQVMATLSIETVMRVPFSPVPLMVGVVSLVVVPLVGEVMTGAAGATVSMVTDSAGLSAEVLPAGSVAVRRMLCDTLLRAEPAVMVYVPPTGQSCVPADEPSMTSVTVSPGVQLPVKSGVLSFVILSVPEKPESVAAVRSGIVGVAGAVISTVIFNAGLGAEVLLAGSVAVTVMA
jgi:hypothetical protein